jgi:Putative transposase
VVFAKRPFAGPEQVLAYLGRYTHRVAIANSRLVTLAGDEVSFSLARLPPPRQDPRQDQGDDTRCRRVHSTLSAPHPPRRLPSHPSLRLSCERPSRDEARALPASSGGTAFAAGCTCR